MLLLALMPITLAQENVSLNATQPISTEIGLAQTCGIDYDNDNLKCEVGESLFNCPSDCSLVNFDTLVCLKEEQCLWNEDWWIKTVVVFMVIIAFYELSKNARRQGK